MAAALASRTRSASPAPERLARGGVDELIGGLGQAELRDTGGEGREEGP